MKITASRKEDILRRKAEYDAAMDAYNQDWAKRNARYDDAERAQLDPIKETLESELSQFNLLQCVVRVEFNYRSLVRVRIQVNEDRKFDENVALAWSYEVSLNPNTGEIARDSSSWSGMQATTRAQLDSLKQSVDALEYLLSVDWASLLNVHQPSWSDYYEGAVEKPAYHDFNSELIEAELADYVGTDTLVKVNNFESSGYGGRYVYVRIIRETPSQYVVNVIAEWTVNNIDSIRDRITPLDQHYTQRVKKSNIVPVVKDGNIVTATI